MRQLAVAKRRFGHMFTPILPFEMARTAMGHTVSRQIAHWQRLSGPDTTHCDLGVPGPQADDPALTAQKIKSGQPLNGIGVFARVGYAPPETNPITVDGSVALVAHGLIDSRKYDSFGVGYYYNAISNDLKNDVALLTAGTSTIKDEQGIEVFYDFAITPAVRLIPSYQHIWQPLAAQVATRQSEADVFLARLNVAW